MPNANLETAREAQQARADAHFAQLKTGIKIIGGAVLLALALRSFAYEPFNIPSESMLPTLVGGDYLFVAKYPYGYGRFSLPLGLPLFDGMIGGNMPERGDIAVFKSPRDNRTDFIKRVIGLPGDRVRVVAGQVELNGKLVRERRGPDFITPTGAVVRRYVEEIGRHRFEVLDLVDGEPRDDTPLMTVPAGHIWVLGDNRDDSADSRLSIAEGGVGFVPIDNLVGRADRVFFSVDGTATLRNPASWLKAVRRDRIGTVL